MKFPVCGVRRERLLAKIPYEYYQLLNSNIECSQDEAQSIYNKFRELSPTGKLTLANFQECLGLFGSLGRLLGERMFKAFDLNNDDFLDFVEFATSLLIMTKGSEDEKLALSYRILHPNPQTMPRRFVSSADFAGGRTKTYTQVYGDSDNKREGEPGIPEAVEEEAKGSHSGEASESNIINGVSKDENSPDGQNEKVVKQKGGEETPERRQPLNFIVKTTSDLIKKTKIVGSNIAKGARQRSRSDSPMPSSDSGIELGEFVDFVNEIALTKALLVCKEPRYYSSEEIYKVFQKYASVSKEGVQRLTQSDYINAVCESSEFLEFLGVSLSQYATESVSSTYRGVNQIFKKINATTRTYINRTNVKRKSVYKWMNGGKGKRGLSVHFGHESWNRVVNMMIGLSISARYVYSQVEKPLCEEDYNVKLCFNMVENTSGLNVTRYITKTGLSSSRFSDINEFKSFVYKNKVANKKLNKNTKDAKESPKEEENAELEKEGSAVNVFSRGGSAEDVASSSSLNIIGKMSNSSVTSDVDLRFSRYYKDNLPPSADQTYSVKSKIIFKEYAPMVFRRIRKISGLSHSEYMESVSPEQIVGNMVLGNLSTMSELVSEGKSGALFYYTINGRLIIKTITKNCAKFVKSWLQSYYEHLEKHPHSILARYYGLFSIENKLVKNKVYFIAMNNVFYSRVSIHRRYDLKGSWVGRSLHPSYLKDHTVALKDLDFDSVGEHVLLGDKTEALLETLKEDVLFLKRSNVLDYSLLLGIHYRDQSVDNVNWDEDPFDPSNQHEIMDPTHTHIYYMGIVDLLTTWNLGKKLERFWRILQTRQHQGVSCVNPAYYSTRFIQSITNHFK